jgi:DUF1009 family protein
VGLIAGNRELPLVVARAVKAMGLPLAICGLEGETGAGLRALADHYAEFPLGRLRPMAEFFLRLGVSSVSMAGGVSRESVLERYDPDEDAQDLMEGLPDYQTDTILRAFGRYLENKGLPLVSVTDLAPQLLVKPGRLGSVEPGPALLEDLSLAFRVARELGRLDVGQTVVVSDLIAVALEGADGTDATIRRGAALSKRPIAVAKVMKPTQDFRLDLPVVGPPTLELLAGLNCAGLALDARGLIMLERERCVSIADKAGMALLAWLEPPATARG